LGAWRDEEQRCLPGPSPGIDPELQPVRLAERKGAIVSQQIDVEIILADCRQREALVAPRQIDLAEIDRARRWGQRRQEARRLWPVSKSAVLDRDRGVRQRNGGARARLAR